MKIIIKQKYHIEDYYTAYSTHWIEYPSIEQLITNLYNFKLVHLSKREIYDKEVVKYHEELLTVKLKIGYDNLIEKSSALRKSYNKRMGITKRVDRTEEWRREQEKLGLEADSARKAVEDAEKTFPDYPQLNGYCVVNGWKINMQGFDIKDYSFFTVEEWLEKHNICEE